MLRRLVLLITALCAGATAVAHAQPGPSMAGPGSVEVVARTSEEPPPQARTATWPMVTGIHVLMGAEPHDRGTPVAFGGGLELLWRGRIGGFVELLASSGTPIVPPEVNGVQQPAFADRISVPFGVAGRPLAAFAHGHGWPARLLAGIGVQLGLSIEHLRTSDDNVTTAGLHVGLALEVPVYGGPMQGGVAIRMAARGLFAPSQYLDNRAVYSGVASAQIFGGITYYP